MNKKYIVLRVGVVPKIIEISMDLITFWVDNIFKQGGVK